MKKQNAPMNRMMEMCMCPMCMGCYADFPMRFLSFQ